MTKVISADQVGILNLPKNDTEVIIGSIYMSAIKYDFKLDAGVPTTDTDFPMDDNFGHNSYFRVTADGNLVRAAIELTLPRTAGTLKVRYRVTPLATGTPVIIAPTSTLELNIDGTYTQYDIQEESYNVAAYTLLKGDKVEPVITTVGFTPYAESMRVSLYMLEKNVPSW